MHSPTDDLHPAPAGSAERLVLPLRLIGNSFKHPVRSFAFERDPPVRGLNDASTRLVLGKKTDDFVHFGTPLTTPVVLKISGQLSRRRGVRFETRSSEGLTLVGLWLEELPGARSHLEWKDASGILQELADLVDGLEDTSSAFEIEDGGALKLHLRGLRMHASVDDPEGFVIYDHEGRKVVVPDAASLPYDRVLEAEFSLTSSESFARDLAHGEPQLFLFLRRLSLMRE